MASYSFAIQLCTFIMRRARHAALLVILGSVPAGCNVVGAVAHVMGPPPVPARYAPAKAPMLVLAENFADPSVGQIQAEQLERFVIDELRAHDVAPLADCEKVYEHRLADPKRFRAMSIDQLGRLAGAAQVLYINLQTSSTDVGQSSEVFQGSSFAQVRIVDVESGRTLWPAEESDGYPVRQDSRLVSARSGIDGAAVQRDVQRALADQIVKLFYKHNPDS